MTKGTLMYERKTKCVYECKENNEQCIVSYNDKTISFGKDEGDALTGKGALRNTITNVLMKVLEEYGIPTYYIEKLSDTEALVKKADMIPLECIVRNYAAGSFCKRFAVKDGEKLESTVLEFCYENEELGDPVVNDYHIEALNLAKREEVHIMSMYALRINSLLSEYLKNAGMELIDIKFEFGKCSNGRIVLADEITPDTCRVMDVETKERFDSASFVAKMGGAIGVYKEVLRRLESI